MHRILLDRKEALSLQVPLTPRTACVLRKSSYGEEKHAFLCFDSQYPLRADASPNAMHSEGKFCPKENTFREIPRIKLRPFEPSVHRVARGPGASLEREERARGSAAPRVPLLRVLGAPQASFSKGPDSLRPAGTEESGGSGCAGTGGEQRCPFCYAVRGRRVRITSWLLKIQEDQLIHVTLVPSVMPVSEAEGTAAGRPSSANRRSSF
ncbi:PREDICTED: uncharacterized protein LOC106148987 [Chinchilla lanigera]|uniref:uncharacterized protein LOC106148987 n=1 Tax=Chinchilla lanigera TaxID=34839 RepID=UPI000695F29B|nr:PREDICTED: uncharacterized protein LOC106148987 [Chinchilla lanigera]